MPSAGAQVIFSVWFVALGLITLVVWRELLVLRARVSLYCAAVVDGLELGEAVRGNPGLPDPVVVAFLFGDCEPCHDVAREVARSVPPSPHLVFVVNDGQAAGSGEGLARTLAGHRAYVGDEARALTDRLRVRSGPLALSIRGGLVRGKGYLRGAADLVAMGAVGGPRVPSPGVLTGGES